MTALGIVLLLAGLISGFAVHDHIAAFGQVWDMNLIGWILSVLGVASVALGVATDKMYTNTSHKENDDITIRHGKDKYDLK